MPLPIPQIRPISDLRTNLNDVCELARESQQPIFMTKNGKASLVVIDCEAYEGSSDTNAMCRNSAKQKSRRSIDRSHSRNRQSAIPSSAFSHIGAFRCLPPSTVLALHTI